MLISFNLSQNMYALGLFWMPSLHPDADAVAEKKDSHLGNYIEPSIYGATLTHARTLSGENVPIFIFTFRYY